LKSHHAPFSFFPFYLPRRWRVPPPPPISFFVHPTGGLFFPLVCGQNLTSPKIDVLLFHFFPFVFFFPPFAGVGLICFLSPSVCTELRRLPSISFAHVFSPMIPPPSRLRTFPPFFSGLFFHIPSCPFPRRVAFVSVFFGNFSRDSCPSFFFFVCFLFPYEFFFFEGIPFQIFVFPLDA